MSNNLIPEELNALIQEYLTDGVLTQKERQVILNKAEKMGLDRDEIDLYLDAQIQKIDQQNDAAVRRAKGKTCPYCGAPVPQLADKCPECGQFITPEASGELQEIFDNLEESLVDLKSGKDFKRSKAIVERYARKAKMYYGSNPKIQKLLAEVENEMSEAENKAKSTQRKDTFISFLKSKWMGTLTTLLIGVITVFGGLHKCETAREVYGEYTTAESNAEVVGAFIFLVGFAFIIAAVNMFVKNISSKK